MGRGGGVRGELNEVSHTLDSSNRSTGKPDMVGECRDRQILSDTVEISILRSSAAVVTYG